MRLLAGRRSVSTGVKSPRTGAFHLWNPSGSFEKTLKTYLFTYQHEGAEWVVELRAENEADALARRAKLALARLDGELVAKVPQTAGWLARIVVAVRNQMKRSVT